MVREVLNGILAIVFIIIFFIMAKRKKKNRQVRYEEAYNKIQAMINEAVGKRLKQQKSEDNCWEDVQEEELYCPDIQTTITRTTQTCSCCKTRIGFIGPKLYLSDSHCPSCGEKMR